jgi:Flp pilus assembly protein TadB
MITRRGVALYGYVALAVMAAMLVLIWYKLVPPSWYWTLFGIALVLFLLRVTLRLLLARRQRLDGQTPPAPHPPDAP